MIEHKTIGLGRYGGIFVIFCIAIHVWVWHLNNKTGSDQLYQTAAAMNFIGGHGISIPHADDTDPAVWHYKKLESWPAGYSVVTGFFLLITGKNVDLTGFGIAVLSFFLLFFSLFKILRSFRNLMPDYAIPLIFVFWSFAYPPFRHLGPSDLLALALFVFAVWLVILQAAGQTSNNWIRNILYAVLIGFIAFGSCFIRYAYYPHALLFFLIYFAANFIHERRITRSNIAGSLIILLITATLTGVQISTQEYTSAMAGEIGKHTSGSPFASWALLYAPFFNAFFSDHFVYGTYMKLVQSDTIPLILFLLTGLVSLFLFVLLFMLLVSSITKKLRIPKAEDVANSSGQSEQFSIIIISAFTIAVNLAFFMLAFYGQPLDLHKSLLVKNALYEQFTVASRYYAPAYLFTQLLLFSLVFALTARKSTAQRILKVFFFCVLLANMGLWIYLRSGLSLISRSENMKVMNLPAGSYTDFGQLGKTIKKETLPVVYAINPKEKQLHYRQVLSSQMAVASGAASGAFYPHNTNGLKPSGNVILYIPLYDDDLQDEKVRSFLKNIDALPHIEMKHCNFVIYRIPLNKK